MASSIQWTLEAMNSVPEGERGLSFLRNRPAEHYDGNSVYVHGSPRDPLSEYIFPEDIYNERKMRLLFATFDRFCFAGHTHVPGVFTEGLTFHTPDECEMELPLGQDKLLINIGSVGQPRDGDPRACYVVQWPDRILFRRVVVC